MHRIPILLFFICLSFTGSAKDFYVALNGNDNNPGTFSKPFASLKQAMLAIRNYPEKSTIFMRNGKYNLTETIIFTSKDTRKNNGVLTIRPYANEIAVLSSDNVLKLSWKSAGNGVFYAAISNSNLKFDQLFLNGNAC